MKRYCCLFLMLAGLMFSACENEGMAPSNPAGEEVLLPIDMSAVVQKNAMVGTKALETLLDEGTGENYAINDFWLLQYDDKGVLIGSPRYYKMESFAGADATVAVVVPQGELKYTCVVIANSHSDQLYSQMGDVSTLEKLSGASKQVSSLESLYNVAGNDLMMNGVKEISSATQHLSFELYRNVAKITVQLENGASSGVEIKSVQMKNVPSRIFYADKLNEGKSPFPASSDAESVDFPVEECAIAAGEMKDLVYYLPRNIQGVTSSTLAANKNNGAPAEATYFEILAETGGIPLRYRFYLGENVTNNFNVSPNYHYTYPITINGAGDPATDSRVENLGKIDLDGANCYIINPLQGTSQPVYKMFISRVNKFWSSTDGNGKDAITESTEWIAEVIWQDASERILDFCNEDGTILTSDDYSGIGHNSFYFKPRKGAKGNVLLGIRPKEVASGKEKESYLWSWHLWITDYDPTPVLPVTEGTYVYQSKSGGYVHHYADAHGNKIWSTTYATKFIMDRNLGAMSATQGIKTNNEDNGSLVYQYGKKDPMPYAEIYDINGKSIFFGDEAPGVKPIRVVAGPTELRTSVNAPYVFYSKLNTGGDWLLDSNPYKSNIWNNPDGWYPEGKNGKSFFDPCPKGWKLPENTVYSIFTNVPSPNNDLQNSANSPAGDEWWFYISAQGSGDKAYYPKNSTRHPYTGSKYDTHDNPNFLGAIWANNHSASHLYFNLSAGSNSAQWNRGSSKSWGYAVRCIQE